MDAIEKELAPHFDILKFELPGHGKRAENVYEYRIEELADEVFVKIENHLPKPVHVIGHSMGGYVAASLAARYPEVISQCILINSITGPDSQDRVKHRNRSLLMIDRFHKAFISMAISNLFNASEHENHAESIELMKKQARKIPESAVKFAIEAMRDRKGVMDKGFATTPLIYIYSKNDPIIDHAIVENEAQLLKADLYALDSGHMAILSHPQEVTELLKPILQFR